MLIKKLCAAVIAAPLLLAPAATLSAQHHRHDNFYNGAYQGGRGGRYENRNDRGDYRRGDYRDDHRGGIDAGKGALIGGAGGAVLGGLLGGGMKGALIGGAAGAGIGAIAGNANANRRHRESRY